MLWRLFRARGKNFLHTVLFGLCYLPTFAALLYQYFAVFDPAGAEGDHGIGFGFAEVWAHSNPHILLCILLVTVFPLVTLICCHKELKTNALYRFSWLLFGVSLAEALFLYEKGERKYHGNFNWGYFHGLSFLFIAALILLLLQTRGFRKAAPAEKAKILVQWFALLWHTVSGIIIFMPYLLGL